MIGSEEQERSGPGGTWSDSLLVFCSVRDACWGRTLAAVGRLLAVFGLPPPIHTRRVDGQEASVPLRGRDATPETALGADRAGSTSWAGDEAVPEASAPNGGLHRAGP